MATYMIGERDRQNLNLDSMRAFLLHELRNKTEGLYFFPDGDAILSDDNADEKFLAILCPYEGHDAVSKGMKHIVQLFLECNKWWHLLKQQGVKKYWEAVATSTSKWRQIDMTPDVAKDVTFALLKARQRWHLRQESKSDKGVKTLLIAALHRLLKRFEAQNPFTDPLMEERGWQLTEGEKKAARESLVPMGPKRQISKTEFPLSPGGPQKLDPISDIVSSTVVKSDWLGLVDEMVSTAKPADGVGALLPSHSQTSLIACSPSVDNSDGLFSPSHGRKKTDPDWLKPLPSGCSSPAGLGSPITSNSPAPSSTSKRRLEDDNTEHLMKKQAAESDTASDNSTGTTSQAPVTPVRRMKWRRPPATPLRPMKR